MLVVVAELKEAVWKMYYNHILQNNYIFYIIGFQLVDNI